MSGGDERCVCGLTAPPITGPVDPYQAATPACWAAFGGLLAGDYSQWRPQRHRLTVDAYMAQHPGFGSPGGRRSVLVHLVGLWLTLEQGLSPPEVGSAMGLVFPDKQAAPPATTPVPGLAGINVADVLRAEPEKQEAQVAAWARFVWDCWRPHHALVRRLADEALARSREGVRALPARPHRRGRGTL